MTEGKPGPWTVKGIDQADREAINAAARRAQQPVGPWLVEAARSRIAHERREAEDRFADVRQAPAPEGRGEAGDIPAPSPSVADLVLILRDLAGVPRCRQVAARARRLLAAQLAAHLPAAQAAATPHAGEVIPLFSRPQGDGAGGKRPLRGPAPKPLLPRPDHGGGAGA